MGMHLTNINELLSLIDYSQNAPALSVGHPFSDVQEAHYWSSTASAGGSPWTVYFGGGVGTSISTNIHYVWPVRGGNWYVKVPSFLTFNQQPAIQIFTSAGGFWWDLSALLDSARPPFRPPALFVLMNKEKERDMRSTVCKVIGYILLVLALIFHIKIIVDMLSEGYTRPLHIPNRAEMLVFLAGLLFYLPGLGILIVGQKLEQQNRPTSTWMGGKDEKEDSQGHKVYWGYA